MEAYTSNRGAPASGGLLGAHWGFLWFALAVLAAVPFFLPGLGHLWAAWQAPEYSHGPLIPILSGYLGTFLCGASFLAVGLLFSAFSRSQLAGAIGTFARIANDPVPRVARADVPPALADCLQRAMAKVPEDRPASMIEFRRQLTDSLRGSATSATTTPLAAAPMAPAPVEPPPVVSTRVRSKSLLRSS